ncbi:unnamed protein product [Lactuca virosa]|uniref:Leucine-rich repeat-containing N-terminal plant-type domain-containing protein n=1 Tax=Lactuca virosa TaxID=75947 RepID=A0AAU9MGS5_9ASTR|nr:unnamed protein product [Lactuca virosa]
MPVTLLCKQIHHLDSTNFQVEMGNIRSFLLFICITLIHLFAINGEVAPEETFQTITVGGGGAPLTEPLLATGGFQSDRLAQAYKVIQAFKKKVTYDPKNYTKTWVGKNICRDYKGFICDVVPDLNKTTVAGVNFNNNNFNGPNLTVSELLIGLKDLAFFHANSNNFTGIIPSDISKLRFNTFLGGVPPQAFLLQLDLLFINNNNFKQTLPKYLGFTPALYLTLANNKFVGGIPRSIGRAANTLREVLFLNNKLNGCLPYEIGLLKKSTVFDVGFNNLTGPIPHSFQCLKKMELLNLAHNKFYNEVPEAVCSLPGLYNFTASYNYFTQVGPQCRKLIKNGVLNVKMNCISGLPNQRSQADCAKFFSNRPTCRREKSLHYVPCTRGNSANELESSDLESTTPAPAPAPLGRSYGALTPH